MLDVSEIEDVETGGNWESDVSVGFLQRSREEAESFKLTVEFTTIELNWTLEVVAALEFFKNKQNIIL